MDPRRNPYAPGAGAPPPELAGRDKLIDTAFTVPLFDSYLRRVMRFETGS